MMPQVSIIIPVYNAEAFLRECIDSALHQTFADIELLLIDDGSTDGCPQICDEVAGKGSRIRVIHQQNAGPSAARNRGLEVACGKYIYFLDSDDSIVPDAIQKLYDLAEAENLDVVLFDGRVVLENGAPHETVQNYIRKGTYSGIHSGRELFAAMRNNQDYHVNVQILFIRKQALLDMGLVFLEGIVHEDELFTFLLMMECKRCAHLPEPLFNRRIRRGSIMTTPQTLKNVNDCLRVLEEAAKYYTTHDFEPEVFPAVRAHMAYFFWNVYSRIRALNAKGRAETSASEKRLFALMKTLHYFNDPWVSRLCRFSWFYEIRSRAEGFWRRAAKRLSAIRTKIPLS